MKQAKKKTHCAVGAVLAVACIAFLAVLGTRKPKEQEQPTPLPSSQSSEADTPQDKEEAIEPEQPSPDSPLGKARAINPDAMAWLRIPGTEIDSPVMQRGDNEYYLAHNEKGEENIWGSYFADYYANLQAPDSLVQNTVLYGHTGKSDNPDGERFSRLFRYLDLAFLQENQNIYLTLGNTELTFEIFAVFYTDIDFYYIDPNPTDQGFAEFMNTVNAKNEFIFEGSTVTQQDRLLTLSGCSSKYDTGKTGNQRLVVMARLLGEGEIGSKKVRANPSPQRPSK